MIAIKRGFNHARLRSHFLKIKKKIPDELATF